MAEHRQYIYLLLDRLCYMLCNNIFLIILFDGNNMTSLPMNDSLDFSKGALAYFETDLKVAQLEYLLGKLYVTLMRFLIGDCAYYLFGFSPMEFGYVLQELSAPFDVRFETEA